jgi:hypothetical protein
MGFPSALSHKCLERALYSSLADRTDSAVFGRKMKTDHWSRPAVKQMYQPLLKQLMEMIEKLYGSCGFAASYDWQLAKHSKESDLRSGGEVPAREGAVPGSPEERLRARAEARNELNDPASLAFAPALDHSL